MSGYQEKPDWGTIFQVRTRKSDKAPQMDGTVTLSRETLEALLTAHRAGKPPKIKIALWDKQIKGVHAFSAKVQYDDYVRQERPAAGGYQPRASAPPPPPVQPIIQNGHVWTPDAKHPQGGTWVPVAKQSDGWPGPNVPPRGPLDDDIPL